MIVLNSNEKKWYSYGSDFAEKVINDSFEAYFHEWYQKDVVKWRVAEMWEKISMKIPKQSIFIEKDSILYSVNSRLMFELVPEDFFEIEKVAHPILRKCFKKCYSDFKTLMKNYRDWEEKEKEEVNAIANIFLNTSRNYFACIESLSNSLDYIKCNFEQILSISLKPKLYDQVCPKLIEVYKNTLLQDDPIFFITKTDSNIRKIYAVMDNLEIKEIAYSFLERELEEIIYEVVPEDTDFLINRIYNHLMLPLVDVMPCMRINKVRETGINATIFLEKRDIPVVCNSNLNCIYAFLKIEHDGDFPTDRQIRYHKEQISVKSLSPQKGLTGYFRIWMKGYWMVFLVI